MKQEEYYFIGNLNKQYVISCNIYGDHFLNTYDMSQAKKFTTLKEAEKITEGFNDIHNINIYCVKTSIEICCTYFNN